MSILLIRHGETALNRARVIQPPATPLSPHGEAQAQALAARLADSPPAALMSSDMPRAARTAQIVAQALDLPVVYNPLLQERLFGDWSGLAYADLDFDPLHDDLVPPNGESLNQFNDRVAAAARAIEELAAQTPGTLAVFSHGLVIRRLLADSIIPASFEGDLSQPLGNTSVTAVSATHPFAVSLMACTTHLANLVSDDNPNTGPVGQY